MPLTSFHPATRAWFERVLGPPTKAQVQSWPAILRGESTLVCSPTGSGKTLAAFLAAIDRVAFGPPPERPGVRVLYISPLRALAVDVEKNLRRPLIGIVEEAKGAARAPTIATRTGDTPQREREQIRKKPPDILITTPESLYLMLSSRAREVLRNVETVIVDEIHQLVPTKRGAHLSISLERLERLRGEHQHAKPLQRIGLSATQKPLEVTARALAGMNRPVTIVDVGEKKPLALSVDAFNFGFLMDVEPGKPKPDGVGSVWPEIHSKILHLVRSHTSTIVFCNSRRLSERLAAALCELAGKDIARAHHGSIAREQRLAIEEMLKSGRIPCIVATSSLELGIDMGAVDLVIQVEAPPQVAAGLQRIGRASHQVGGVPAGVILSKHRGDLLACAAAAEGILENDVEAVAWPKNPLDVLAQQIVATCLEQPIRVADMLALVRRAAPYGDLPDSAFHGVLEMLSGRYPSHAFAGLRARITWDRQEGILAARDGAASIVVSNAGTIPDRGLYGVFWEREGKSTRVGELDEEMVFESREGDVFLLGATSWRIERITPDRVMVVPAPGEEARMPFWRGDGPGRARPFGLRIGAMARELAEDQAAKQSELATVGLTRRAVKELTRYIADQKEATIDVPSDRTIVVERALEKDLRVVILTPLGARVHAPWALAVVQRLREAGRGAPDVLYTDDGIAFRIAEGEMMPELELFLPTESEIDALLQRALPGSQLFASRFRECAARALLLPRNRAGKRTPLWAQRKRSTDLLAVASQYPDFPMLLEAMRECLAEAFDLDGLKSVLRGIADETVSVRLVDSKKPSPFAKNVLFSFIGAFLYDEDMPAPERRAQALHVDHAQLQELLGEADLRSLLEPEVIEAHERFLQRLDTARASSVDGLHDLLLSLGDLSRAEIRDRFDGDAEAAIATLIGARRVFETTIAGEPRIVAAEDASRVRDALGAAVPGDLPADLLEAVRDPLGDLVLRYARTHGPFLTEDVDRRFGTSGSTADVLQRLAERGLLRFGAFRPEGKDSEWCNADVLGSLRGRTLAALKKASAPASADALARFTLAWHGIGKKTTLETAIEKLEGLPIGIGILENDVLPARVEGFRKADLDALVATGRIAWVALETTQRQDVRIMIAASEREAELLPPPGHAPGELCEQVRSILRTRGASFSSEIAKAVGGFQPNVGRALWELMFAQEISNDTLDAARVVAGGSTGRIREGRWFLRGPRLERVPSLTEVVAARTSVLLARHGVLTREAASAENVEGGFSRIYPVLRAMEDAGRLQRGLFAEGTSGLQFALPTALALLRQSKNESSGGIVLAATDPANLWGSVFSWPDHEVRVTRSIGAHVVLVDGALAAWIPASGDALVTWKCDEAIVCETLAKKLMPHGRVFFTAIDGKPPREHPLAAALREVGFFPFGPGLARENREEK